MRTNTTYVYGVAADQAGIIVHEKVWSEKLSGGGVRINKETRTEHEPATVYAANHPAPMPMKLDHGEQVGQIVALRRDHGRLLALGKTDLTPDELAHLTEKAGDLRWSTFTENRRNEPLRITEISLTVDPATVGLPAVRWYRLGSSKGNPPAWVTEELKRADKMELRQRRQLVVNDLDYEKNPYLDLERYRRDIGLVDGGPEGRTVNLDGEIVPIEHARPSKILGIR
jgi:hypothetical protein